MAVNIVVDRYMNVVLATASKPIFGGFPNPCNDQAADVIRIQAMLYGPAMLSLLGGQPHQWTKPRTKKWNYRIKEYIVYTRVSFLRGPNLGVPEVTNGPRAST